MNHQSGKAINASYNPAQEGIEAVREDDRLAKHGLAYADADRTVLRRLDGGTPRTLSEAIENGVRRFHDPKAFPNSVELTVENCVRLDLRDFLAQRFGAALLDADQATALKIEELWTMITGEKLK